MERKELTGATDLVGFFECFQSAQTKDSLQFENGSAILTEGGRELARISSHSIEVAGIDFSNQIGLADTQEPFVLPSGFNQFLHSIKGHVTRLNHFGLGYNCGEVSNEEKDILRKVEEGRTFDLFKEDSGDPKLKWLFIGKKDTFPKFEITLSEYPFRPDSIWQPHIQIDLDTSLDYQELSRLQKEYMPGIEKWKLEFPAGIVLVMWHIGRVGGLNLWFGCGTNKRGKQSLEKLS